MDETSTDKKILEISRLSGVSIKDINTYLLSEDIENTAMVLYKYLSALKISTTSLLELMSDRGVQCDLPADLRKDKQAMLQYTSLKFADLLLIS